MSLAKERFLAALAAEGIAAAVVGELRAPDAGLVLRSGGTERALGHPGVDAWSRG